MWVSERRIAEGGATQKQQRPLLDGDSLGSRGADTPGEGVSDNVAAGGLVSACVAAAV